MKEEVGTSIEGDGEFPHIGKLIARKLEEKNVRKVELGRRMGVFPQSINRYVESESLQFSILWEVALALEYNFFADLMMHLPKKVLDSGETSFHKTILAQAEEIRDLKKEIEIYKGILKR